MLLSEIMNWEKGNSVPVVFWRNKAFYEKWRLNNTSILCEVSERSKDVFNFKAVISKDEFEKLKYFISKTDKGEIL